MRVAAVAWRSGEETPERVLDRFRHTLDRCSREGVEVVVFPALIGCFFEEASSFLDRVLPLSEEHPRVAICPGSFWEREGEAVYHASCLIRGGEVLLRQRQLYLARWEREEGLSRGEELALTVIGEYRTAIILSTDVFYPQVSRYAALSGADLILSPVAIRSDGKSPAGGNFPLQISGLWANVQANMFFAVESGFKGMFRGRHFAGRSLVHAPLAMTLQEDGFLAMEQEGSAGGDLILADLDLEKRKAARRPFDPLRQLNREVYRHCFPGV